MLSNKNVSPLRKARYRARRPRLLALLAALILLLVGIGGLGARPVLAIPPEPIPEPIGDDPFEPPAGGFDWSRPSRVALAYNAWIRDTGAPFGGHYDPAYVNPTSFSVRFDGCRTADEAKFGNSDNTYRWTLKGSTIVNNKCRFTDSFSAQGTFPVSLKITAPDGTVVLGTVTQDVIVKDLLIVALGDSYAAGEGAPDEPQVVAMGYVPIPARWWDERCHRSMYAPSAQAAWMLEKRTSQVSVTYLSFACSGATINKVYYKDVSAFNPFAAPSTRLHPIGTGILGPYAGAVLPHPDNPEVDRLPSQINQLTSTLTLNGPARQIDALILDGGGNDINFGGIASLCSLYYDCPVHATLSADWGGYRPLSDQVASELGSLPGRYKALADAITGTNLPIAHKYISEYPDSTRNDNGQFCGKMLDDVIPNWLAPVLAIAASNDGSEPPFPPYQIDRGDDPDTDEVAWAGTAVLPGLNAAIIAAAQTNNWTLVDGIADAQNNLFSGHGYCASDNWIRRASEASLLQGPIGDLPPGTALTKGTLHPTERGYRAMAERMFAKLLPDLLPNPGPQPTPPTVNPPDFSQSVKGANGWLTGHVAGVTCPAGAANCAAMQQTASVNASTSIAGIGLSINGASTACPSTPTLLNGVICSAQVLSQTVGWSFAFPNDGIFHLEFSVSTRNGAVGGFSQDIKVDLHDPAASSSLSTPTPVSGWFNAPLTVTLSGADGVGSGVQMVQYQLDSGSQQPVNGNAAARRLDTDGTHTFGYLVKDYAGRQSAAQSLTVKLDQIAPSITITAPAGAAYVLNQVAVAGYSCSDSGSGVASCAGTAANNANIDTASPGTKTFTVNAGDIAGNTSSKSVNYNVGYNVCALYDQARSYKAGSTVPIKLQLCDAKGANMSTSGILPVATGLTQKDSTASSEVTDSGNANPDAAFRFDATLNGYIFNLSTKGVTTGTWALNFSVRGDAVSHAVLFDVK